MSIVEAEQQRAPVSVRVTVGSREISFETGKLAKQADGAVAVRSGDTMVQATEQESELDLIVVGTKEGLTMVEAGANEVPEDKLLEALDLAHREIIKLCEAQEDLRSQAGKAKWLDPELTASLEEKYGAEI